MAVRLNYVNKKAEHDLELRKEQKKIKRIQEEWLRVSSENQFQLFGKVRGDQRE